MNDDQAKQLKEIEALLAERRTFEQWLAQLEAHRDSTPAHVYAKVRADYEARFAAAQGRLGAATESVRALMQGMERALSAQDLAIGAKADERAEAGVRAAVGEFSAKELDKRKGALDSAIAALESDRATKQREMETLRALLAEATPGTATPVEADNDRAAEPANAVSVPAAITAPEPAVDPLSAPARFDKPPAPPVDEVAFLRSVLGRATPQRTPLAVPVVEPESDGESSAESEAPFLVPPTAPDSAATETGRRDTPLSMPADQARESGAYPSASRTFGNPTPKTSEAQKSLTCSACGALNFPTEWYCEKCGGELAAF